MTLYTPLNGTISANGSLSQLFVDFSENVKAGSGAITVTRLNDGVVQTLLVPSSSVTFNAKRVTLQVAQLNISKSYVINIPSTVIQSYANNYFLGTSYWTFITAGLLLVVV